MSKRQFRRVLVTGGAGFIGSNFLLRFAEANPETSFLNLDKLSYAAHPMNIEAQTVHSNISQAKCDLADATATMDQVSKFNPDAIVHFAAETHVDRSIHHPEDFVSANINGTLNLLLAAKSLWPKDSQNNVFIHVSTDEVFGELGPEGLFSETSAYDPSSPYSASKAASDHLARSFRRTFGLPIIVTNCGNNYGPRQFPEKLIPVMISAALEGRPLPVYGNGLNVREWIHVDDHNDAIWKVLEAGRIGETYLIGSGERSTNIDIIHAICDGVSALTGQDAEEIKGRITSVNDRPGHDFRYAINSDKIRSELGWSQNYTLKEGLRKTIEWYLGNKDWSQFVKSPEFTAWLAKNYEAR